MIELVYSPKWFFGKDILIDTVSISVLFLISIFTIRYYKLSGKKNYMHFAYALILMALSFGFKILTNFTLYYDTTVTKQLGALILTFNAIRPSNILFIVGFLMYRLLMLLGLYVLYSVYTKQEKVNILLILYLIFISTIFSTSAYYIFYLTSLLFLSIITWRYHLNYLKNKHITNRLLLISFSVITISQVIFVFVSLNTLLYVIAEIVQLIGYILLFVTFVKVINSQNFPKARHRRRQS